MLHPFNNEYLILKSHFLSIYFWIFCVSQMRHGRHFSKLITQKTLTCVYFPCPKWKKIALKQLFEVPHVCLVGTCGAFLAYLAIFAAAIYLSH